MAIMFSVTYYKNDGSGTTLYCEDSFKNVLDGITTVGANWGETAQNWSRTGYNFLYWNTAADGSGTSISAGEIFTGRNATVYAMWQVVAGDDVVISLGETEITTMNATGTKTLATQGTYVTDDITIEYTKPSVSLQNKTVSPTTSSQSVMADSGYDGLGTVTVNAISPTKSAQTYTPTTSNQTIASGQWLTGAQTILGDANLTAENIKKDVSIFGVTGTYEGSGGGSTLDILIRCNNSTTSSWSTSASDYEIVSGTITDIFTKSQNHELIEGRLVRYYHNYDDEESTSWDSNYTAFLCEIDYDYPGSTFPGYGILNLVFFDAFTKKRITIHVDDEHTLLSVTVSNF